MATDKQRRKLLLALGSGIAGSCMGGCMGKGDEEDVNQEPVPERQTSYGWEDATSDSYWYSLYNMGYGVYMSGNGLMYPNNEQQRRMFDKRVSAMVENSDVDEPVLKNQKLSVAPFTTGDPTFAQKPEYTEGGSAIVDTFWWDRSKSSGVVSPSSAGWTFLKALTWAKHYQTHLDTLPDGGGAKFRTQMLSTHAQLGIEEIFLSGGPDRDGLLTEGGGSLAPLVSGIRLSDNEVVDSEHRHNHHAAMVWFLSNMVSFSNNGWYGYENPEPIVSHDKIRQVADEVAKYTLRKFPPEEVVSSGNTRDLGLMLGAVGWYGTHAGDAELLSESKQYLKSAVSEIESNLAGNGKVMKGSKNQAATQGVVGQGLLWASLVSDSDYSPTAREVLGYMFEELWDDQGRTFKSGRNEDRYRITARDAGDITGGINAAGVRLDIDIKDTYSKFFNNTFRIGRLQGAARGGSRDKGEEGVLPLPISEGGDFGQAAVYNRSVEYDSDSDQWTVTDDTFHTASSMYLANQQLWIGRWDDKMHLGRGVPGETDEPPNSP